MVRRRMLMNTQADETGSDYSLVDSDCIALFHFNKNTKNEVSGSSPTGNYITYDTGKFGYAARITSSSGGIQNAVSYSTNSNTKFTIDFWVYPIYRDTSYNGAFTLVTSGNYNLFAVNTKFGSSSDSMCKLFVDFFKNGENYGDGTNYCATVTKAAWHHVALTYDFSSSKGVAFVDGVKVKEYSIAMPTGTYTLRLLMKPDNYRGHLGRLDEFHMSNKILWTSNFTPPTEPWTVS